MNCLVCDSAIQERLYRSSTDLSITSLCEVRPEPTQVYFCSGCGHLQTETTVDLPAYYDHDYRILIHSAEEDQLYAIVDGRRVFRTEHQVETLLRKVQLEPGSRVLDYGCAKSSTFRLLASVRPDLDLHVFDISEMYLPFWRSFIREENWATHSPKTEWAGRFDLVTSFFALEHAADPVRFVRDIAGLLKTGGYFYCIVPNVYANSADLVVADHVHHFSRCSLQRLIESAGLEWIEADDRSHTSAWLLIARKRAPVPTSPSHDELDELSTKSRQMAAYWQTFADRVRAFESSRAGAASAAIYGSGFYGTFIATCLAELTKVRCFLDQNPHRQRQTLLGKPILPPDQLPDDIEVVYVGLNPVHARQAIAAIDAWQERQHVYFFP